MDLNRFDSAWLEGLTRFERARDALEREFIAPAGDELMANVMAAMGPDQQAMMQQLDPGAVQAIIQKLTGGM